MPDITPQEAYEELQRRQALTTPEQQEAARELIRRAVLTTSKAETERATKALSSGMGARRAGMVPGKTPPPTPTPTPPARLGKEKAQEFLSTGKTTTPNTEMVAARPKPAKKPAKRIKPEPVIAPRETTYAEEIVGLPMRLLDQISQGVADLAAGVGLQTEEGRRRDEARAKEDIYRGQNNLPPETPPSFYDRLAPEQVESLENLPYGLGGVARVGKALLDPSNILPLGGALNALRAGKKASMVARGASAALAAPMLKTGAEATGRGIADKDLNDITEGILSLGVGGLATKGATSPRERSAVAPTPEELTARAQGAARTLRPSNAQLQAEPPTMPPIPGRPPATPSQELSPSLLSPPTATAEGATPQGLRPRASAVEPVAETPAILAAATDPATPALKAILDEIASFVKEPMPRIVEMIKLKGSDGNWYRPGGVPIGVKTTGEKRSEGFAYASREGRTYGQIEKTQEALIQKHNARQEKNIKDVLDSLAEADDDKLKSAYEYWTKKKYPDETEIVTQKEPAKVDMPAMASVTEEGKKERFTGQKKGVKLRAENIADFDPARNIVIRENGKTYVVDRRGEYKRIEVVSDILDEESAARLRALTGSQRDSMINAIRNTPYLSADGKKERLSVLSEGRVSFEVLDTPSPPRTPSVAKTNAETPKIAPKPAEIVTSAQKEPPKPPSVTQPSQPPAPESSARIRHRDIEETLRAVGIEAPAKETIGWKETIDRAARDYDTILPEVKRWNSESGAVPTMEMRAVAGMRLKEVTDQLAPLLEKEGRTPQEQATMDALIAESGQVGKFLHKAGSELGRGLNFQKAILPNPTDRAAVIAHAESATDGKLSPIARRALIRLADEAQAEESAIVARAEGKATPQSTQKTKPLPNRFGEQNKVFTADKAEAARARLREKLNKASAGIDPSIIPDLVEIGGFYAEGGLRQFGKWAAKMREEIPANVTNADLQRIWVRVRATAAGDATIRPFPAPTSLIEELTRRLGVPGAEEFVAKLDESSPGLFDKIVNQKTLTDAEKLTVGRGYLEAQPKRGRRPKSAAMQAISDAGSELAKSQRPPRTVTPEQKAQTVKTNLEKRIDAVEAQLRGEQAKSKPAPISTPEIETLRVRLKELREKLPKTSSPMSQSLKEALLERNLKKRIAEVEARLKDKEEIAKANPVPISTPRIDALRKQLEDLRAKLPEVKRTGKPRTEEAVMKAANELLGRLGTVKSRTPAGQISEGVVEYAKGARSLQAFTVAMRKKHGNLFSEERLQEMFSEAAQEYAKDSKRLDDIKARMGSVVAREVYRNKPWLSKAMQRAADVGDFYRTMRASFDVSGLARQGGILAISRTGLGGRAATKMMQAVRDENVARAVDAQIRTRPNASIYEKAGLDLVELEGTVATGEEGFGSQAARNIPGVGVGVKASERAYTTVLNTLRADTFDALYDFNMTEAQARDIARYINVSSGRGDLSPQMAQAMPALARTLFSPRYAISRFQYLMGEPLWSASSPKTAKIIAKEYARYYGKIFAVLALANAAGAEVSADPRSSDFGVVRVGNLEMDLLSGLKQVFVFLAKNSTQKTVSANEYGKPTERDYDMVKGAGSFARGKLAPLPSMAVDFVSGKDFKGDPLDSGDVATRLLPIPITAQNAIEALREQGFSAKVARDVVAASALDTVGVGANVRDRGLEQSQKRQKLMESRQRGAAKRSGSRLLPRMNLKF